MRGLKRRIATFALLGVVANVAPTEGRSWLRGGSSTNKADEEKQNERREQVFQFPTSNPSDIPSLVPTQPPSLDTSGLADATSSPTASTTPPTVATNTTTESLSILTMETSIPIEAATNAPSKSTSTSAPTTSPTGATPATSAPTEATVAPTASTAVPTTAPSDPPENGAVTESEYSQGAEATYDMTPELPEETDMEEEAEDEDIPPRPPTETPTKSPPTNPPTPSPTAKPTAAPTTAQPTNQELESLGALEQASELEKEEEKVEVESKPAYRQTFYEGDKFDMLPMNAKAAAMTLGYTQTSWDLGEEVYSSSMLWDALSPEEAMAATILGYDEKNWNARHTPGASPVVPAASAHSSGTGFTSSWTVNGDNAAQPQSSETVAKPQSSDTMADAETSMVGAHGGLAPQAATSADVETPAVAAPGSSTPQATDVETPAVADPGSNIPQAVEPEISSGMIAQAPARPDYLSLKWGELPALQKTAAEQLGYGPESWNNNELVVTSYLHWNQLTFDLRQAAKVLGIRAQNWNMAVEQRGPPTGTASSAHSSFYSHPAQHAGEADTEEGGEEGDEQNAREDQVKEKREKEQVIASDFEPQINEMESEIGVLKKQLDNAVGKIKVQEEKVQAHEQILKVLQGMDPQTTIGSVADIIQLGKRNRNKNRNKKNRKEEPVAPMEIQERGGKTNGKKQAAINISRTIDKKNGGRDRKKKKRLERAQKEPEVAKRTFWANSDSGDTDGSNAQEAASGYGSVTRTWESTRNAEQNVAKVTSGGNAGTIFGVGVP